MNKNLVVQLAFIIKWIEKGFLYSEKLILDIPVFICKYSVLLCYFFSQERA